MASTPHDLFQQFLQTETNTPETIPAWNKMLAETGWEEGSHDPDALLILEALLHTRHNLWFTTISVGLDYPLPAGTDLKTYPEPVELHSFFHPHTLNKTELWEWDGRLYLTENSPTETHPTLAPVPAKPAVEWLEGRPTWSLRNLHHDNNTSTVIGDEWAYRHLPDNSKGKVRGATFLETFGHYNFGYQTSTIYQFWQDDLTKQVFDVQVNFSPEHPVEQATPTAVPVEVTLSTTAPSTAFIPAINIWEGHTCPQPGEPASILEAVCPLPHHPLARNQP